MGVAQYDDVGEVVPVIHVWGFDPGLATGWCHLSVHFDGEIGIFNCGEGDHFQIGNMLYDNPALKAAVVKREIETVFAVEKFTISPGKTQAPWSLETIGLIRYFSNFYHIPFFMSSPSQHKPLIKDEVIKRAGLWVPGKRHAMDAVRVAMYHLIKERRLLTEWLKEK